MSFGGGSQSSSSNSFGEQGSLTDAFSNSASSSAIDKTQAGFLGNLWSKASNLASPSTAIGAATDALGATMGGLKSDFSALGAMTDPSALIKTQSAALKEGLGSLFREEINPGIRTAAIGSGGFGGGRQGVAQGVATGQLADAFTQGLGDITANANNLALGATAQRSALGQNIFTLGQSGALAGLTPLTQLAAILGGPTVTSQSQSTAGTSSSSYGYNNTYQRSGGKNFSFGLS